MNVLACMCIIRTKGTTLYRTVGNFYRCKFSRKCLNSFRRKFPILNFHVDEGP